MIAVQALTPDEDASGDFLVPSGVPRGGPDRGGRRPASRPIVDVAIPTHGRPKYLRETIESVLAQTFGGWRITISENGVGSDEIRAIVEPYLSDPRVRHVPTGTAIAAAENATRAVQAGDAPFVGVLHDDDRWDAEFLARRVAFLESNPSCGLVFSHCDFIDPAGALVFRRRVALREGLQQREVFLRALYKKNIIVMPTVLGRRSAYERVGSAFSKSLLFDDYEMWVRIAVSSDVGFLDVFDASYRIHPAQMTHPEKARFGEHRLDLLEAIDRWLPPDFPLRERRRAHSAAHFRATYDAFERGERRDATLHLLKALRKYPVALFDPKMVALAMDAVRRSLTRQRRLVNAASKNDRSPL
jgi:glycosyltransferase involved in cell wall biosynthesis